MKYALHGSSALCTVFVIDAQMSLKSVGQILKSAQQLPCFSVAVHPTALNRG